MPMTRSATSEAKRASRPMASMPLYCLRLSQFFIKFIFTAKT